MMCKTPRCANLVFMCACFAFPELHAARGRMRALCKHTLRCFWPKPSLHIEDPKRLQLPSCAVMTTAPHASPNKMHVPAKAAVPQTPSLGYVHVVLAACIVHISAAGMQALPMNSLTVMYSQHSFHATQSLTHDIFRAEE